MRRVLHVGCGRRSAEARNLPFPPDRWRELRLDIDPGVEPDIVASITDMSVVASASMDAVYSSHNLEHLHAHEVPHALREFRRVLQPGGILVLFCPDLESICARVLEAGLTAPAYESPSGPITPLDMIYGHSGSIARGRQTMAHRTGFTMPVLEWLLERCGFAGRLCRSVPDSFELRALATPSARPASELEALAVDLLADQPG